MFITRQLYIFGVHSINSGDFFSLSVVLNDNIIIAPFQRQTIFYNLIKPKKLLKLHAESGNLVAVAKNNQYHVYK